MLDFSAEQFIPRGLRQRKIKVVGRHRIVPYLKLRDNIQILEIILLQWQYVIECGPHIKKSRAACSAGKKKSTGKYSGYRNTNANLEVVVFP